MKTSIPKILFNESHIIFPIVANSKKEIVKKLLMPLLKYKEVVNNEEELLNGLLIREKKGSTGMQDGLAIPHFRSNLISKTYLSLGVNSKGIFFDAIDSKATKILVLALFPSSSDEMHLKLLSKVCRFLYNKALRKKIYASSSQAEVWKLTEEIKN